MKFLRDILPILFLAIAMPALAQNDSISHDPRTSYNIAESDFNQGYFDHSEKRLLSCIRQLRGMHKTSAYRLLALCAFEKGDHQSAKRYVDLLLKNDPYYTVTLNDPQCLVDLITEAKSQSAGITTASRQAESIEEAPVPVTLITEEMIRYSGASTLQELLCLYVPGMSNIEGMESNIAMHGIYGLSQDKILFLQDGHRLNGSSTNAEAPDYRNSLDKIQQIEVLRGPASSLYGNVALTAVVNIITRKGAVLNGGRVSGVIGSQQTYGGSFVIGGGNNVVDVIGWGSVNSTNGFRHVVDNMIGGKTTLYSSAYNKRPSYDIGIKGRWGDFTMTLNSQRSKKTPYLNVLQLPADQVVQDIILSKTNDYSAVTNFSQDNYEMVGSNGPGITRTNHHINIDYSHSFGNIDLMASGYMSLENTSFYNVLGDSIDTDVATLMLIDVMTSTPSFWKRYEQMDEQALMKYLAEYAHTRGVFQVMEWENITLGGQMQMLARYNFLGHGSAVLGAQYEHFALTNGTLFLGGKGNTEQMTSSGSVFEDGMEDVISGYAQVKHYFSPRFILNAGLRFDHKSRFNKQTLSRFSPRMSLIYKFSDALSGRASYNYSFVDAPYIYRACIIELFSGGPSMAPETMKSFQAGLSYNKPGSPFKAEISGYFNSLDNLITQNLSREKGYLFINAGRVKQGGVDLSAQYTTKRFFTTFNATWQKVFSSSKYNVQNGNRLGIPQWMGKIAATWSPYYGRGHGFFTGGKLWVNVNAVAQTETLYQKADILSSYYNSSFCGTNVRVLGNIILGAGLTYEWKYLDLNITAKNLTNNEYMVGSILSNGVPHAGRQIIGKVTVKF